MKVSRASALSRLLGTLYMGSNQGGLPFFYLSDEQINGVSLFPFIVAPYGQFQDSLFLSPATLGRVEKAFISNIYKGITVLEISTVAFRTFVCGSTNCIAIILPTTLKDEGGRSGLALAVGVIASPPASRKADVLVDFLDVLIAAVDVGFEMALLEGGASDLLANLANKQQLEQVTRRLKLVGRITTLAARCALAGKQRPRWYVLPFGVRQTRRGKLPDLILYQSGASVHDLMAIIVGEVAQVKHEVAVVTRDTIEECKPDTINLMQASQTLLKNCRTMERRFRGVSYNVAYNIDFARVLKT